MISHWHELPWTCMERGRSPGDRQNLAGDPSATVVGMPRMRADGDKWPTAAHVEGIIVRAEQRGPRDGEDRGG